MTPAAALQVELRDVTARDGLQDEPVFVATAEKVEIARATAATGVAVTLPIRSDHPSYAGWRSRQ